MRKSQKVANARDILKAWEGTVKHWKLMGNSEKLAEARQARDKWKKELEVRRNA